MRRPNKTFHQNQAMEEPSPELEKQRKEEEGPETREESEKEVERVLT